MFILLQKLKNKTLNSCETFPNLVEEFQSNERQNSCQLKSFQNLKASNLIQFLFKIHLKWRENQLANWSDQNYRMATKNKMKLGATSRATMW
jgi:hypothetical protein